MNEQQRSALPIHRRDVYAIPAVALRSVTSKIGMGVYASSDTLFKGAVFGRDSLEVAEDLMGTKSRLAGRILLTLASLQGEEQNAENEEEPGKIVHEYRNVVVDGKHIRGKSLEIFHELSSKWGGNEREMAYYGSVDSTPQFLRTLYMYCRMHRTKILQQRVKLKSGQEISVLDAAERAAGWVGSKLEESQSGLIEYCKANPHGIANQVWKDSAEFYVHEDETMANHDKPIASIEVQGLAYDGLVAASHLFPDRRKEYSQAARQLRDKAIELLWLPERNYFALGTDFSEDDQLRTITTPTANPAALLDTGFFDELPAEERQKYISAIVSTVISGEFLTDAGIRSRALSAAGLIKFWDYHGSYVTWPKETYDIAKGLRRQGFGRLARQLENRLLNIFFMTRGYPEFMHVDGMGRVLSIAHASHTHGELTIVESTNVPERVQAWTVSAIIAIIGDHTTGKLRYKKPPTQRPWQQELENRLLAGMPQVKRYINPIALAARYPNYPYKVSGQKH